jgi:hypothetical protein
MKQKKPLHKQLKELWADHPVPFVVALITSIVTIINSTLQAIHIIIKW